MKLFKVLAVCLMLLVNLLVVQPAFADRPKLSENTDYLAITESLEGLLQARAAQQLPEGISSEAELQQQITALQYQKYIVENGRRRGECLNQTSQPIAVYGPVSKKAQTSGSTYEKVPYLLPAGEATDDDWDCSGVYLPNDARVAGLTSATAGAVKILAGTRLVVTENPDTGVLEFNLPPAQVFQEGEINWEIPNLSAVDIGSQFPEAPID